MFVLFVTLILLWLFREPKFIPGWGSVFSTDDDGRRYVCVLCLIQCFMCRITLPQVQSQLRNERMRLGVTLRSGNELSIVRLGTILRTDWR